MTDQTPTAVVVSSRANIEYRRDDDGPDAIHIQHAHQLHGLAAPIRLVWDLLHLPDDHQAIRETAEAINATHAGSST